jgi:hypothetical protein
MQETKYNGQTNLRLRTREHAPLIERRRAVSSFVDQLGQLVPSGVIEAGIERLQVLARLVERPKEDDIVEIDVFETLGMLSDPAYEAL